MLCRPRAAVYRSKVTAWLSGLRRPALPAMYQQPGTAHTRFTCRCRRPWWYLLPGRWPGPSAGMHLVARAVMGCWSSACWCRGGVVHWVTGLVRLSVMSSVIGETSVADTRAGGLVVSEPVGGCVDGDAVGQNPGRPGHACLTNPPSYPHPPRHRVRWAPRGATKPVWRSCDWRRWNRF